MDSHIVKRNTDLITEVTHYILNHPEVLDHLPGDFRLVVLPEDDRELSQYNLDLLALRSDQTKPVVIVRLAIHPTSFETTAPELYVPLVA